MDSEKWHRLSWCLLSKEMASWPPRMIFLRGKTARGLFNFEKEVCTFERCRTSIHNVKFSEGNAKRKGGGKFSTFLH